MEETIWDRLDKGIILPRGDPGAEEYNRILEDCRMFLTKINSTPMGRDEYTAKLSSILREVGEGTVIVPPFQCDLGRNISIGKNSLINYGCVLLDTVLIEIGNNTMIGPGCNIVTAVHPTDPEERRNTLVGGKKIRIGNNVWLGANVTVLPGISIGDGSVVGAGSVVTKNIDSNTTVVGNPARPIK